MRNLIVSISILCLALSGLITFQALNLPEKQLRNSVKQPPITLHESAQVVKEAVQKPSGEQAPGKNVNQTLQNTVSRPEQKLADNIADSQKDIQALENTVKQLEQKLADKIEDSQKNTRSAEITTVQLEQKLADNIADSQKGIQALENTVKQLEQKLANEIANSQKNTRSAEITTAQLEQKLADNIADSQEHIRSLENTVKQLEQKLANEIANSQKNTRSAVITAPQQKQKTASHKNTSQNISKIGKTEKSSGPLLFSVNFNSGEFVIKNSTKKLIKQYTQYISSLPQNYRVVVEGHTDSSPLKIIFKDRYPYKDNMGLSLFRAETVAGMFEKEGVSSERITAIGYGASRPIATNTTVEGRAKNRRVVVRLIPGEKEI